MSYRISELIAKNLKPHGDGVWAKKMLVKPAEKLAPTSVYMYQKFGLSRPTVCECIKEMGQDIEGNLKKKLINSLTLPCVLMKQRTSTTLGSWQYFLRDDIRFLNYRKLVVSRIGAQDYLQRGPASEYLPALRMCNLPLDKLCRVATDGAPAMVGTHKELVSLLKKEMNAKKNYI